MARVLGALAFVGCVWTLTATSAQQRGVPRAVRQALVGCWVPWEGERWTIRRHGATGLVMDQRVDLEVLRERFGRATRPGPGPHTLSWIGDREAVQMHCGPRTQHGQFCMVKPEEGGTLAVGFYARGHGRRHRSGRLVSTTSATRCE